MAFQLSSKKVAVVGCGAAGLAAARQLRKEGHEVVVFERGSQLGGIWVYTPEVDSDMLGLDPTRKMVHSSVYSSVRTNVPREAMSFRDFPFVPTGKANRDSRRFPSHEEVLRYLEDYAREFRLFEVIRYHTEVRHVGLNSNGTWMVKYRKVDGVDGSEVEETYDAVVVCSGHFTQPLLADNIPGIDLWPGRQIHSHNYRTPEPYKDQVVIVIGLALSGIEISSELTNFAKEVHIASKTKIPGNLGKHPAYDNLWIHPMIERAHKDGSVLFQDGSVVRLADVILHCTGYTYKFPFLETGGIVKIEDNRIDPLYKHVFPPMFAPGLSFVGIPSYGIHFYIMELQSKWIAGVLSKRISLPSEKEIMEDIEAFYSELKAKGVPKCHTHRIHNYKFSTERLKEAFEYEDWLAAQSGCPPAEEWRKNMFFTTLTHLPKHTGTFRDELDYEDGLVLQAYQDFEKIYVSVEDTNTIATSALSL